MCYFWVYFENCLEFIKKYLENFVEAFLKTHRNGLSILLHKITKEGDLYDHTFGARWLGNKLKLNLEIFEEE